MKGLLARLQKKYAKLPLWAWASAAGGAGWYFMRRKGSTAADQVAAGDSSTLPGSADVYGAGDSGGSGGGTSATGDVAPLDAVGAGPLTAGQEWGDAGVTSDFQDFMSQLESNALQGQPATIAPPTPGGEATDPTTTATAKLPAKAPAKGRARGIAKWIPSRKGEKGHWALPNGSWAPAPKGAKPPKPKPPAKPSSKPKRPNRVTAAIGKARGGARARPPAAKPKTPPRPAPKARPRGIAKKTVAAPKAKPAARPFALPGMKPVAAPKGKAKAKRR
jgi:hypothetical protein